MSTRAHLSVAPAAAPPPAQCPFLLSSVAKDPLILQLLVSATGSQAAPQAIWSRTFQCTEEVAAVVDSIANQQLGLALLGHLTLNFGVAETDQIVDEMISEYHKKLEADKMAAAEDAKNYLIIDLLRFEKYKLHCLELQRKSREDPDWFIRFGRAAERDRLYDWLRWQKPRFGEFLDYAEKFGREGLSKRLIAEMFETERRVKKEGQSAGGSRPLRMWRGV